MIGKPKPVEFTYTDRCNTGMIWNCFRGTRNFKPVQIAVVESQIGINVPGDMLVRNRLLKFYESEAEYYELTEIGEEWITKKIFTYLKTYPAEIDSINNLPYSIRIKL